MKVSIHHGTRGFFRSALKSVVALGLASTLLTAGLGAISALPASATTLSTDQAIAVTDQIAYLTAGGLASNAVFTADATAAIGTDDAVLVTANAALAAATAALNAASATQLAADQATASADQVAYLTAGGLASDAVFTADVSAAAGTKDAVLVTANAALVAATAAVTAAEAQLDLDQATAATDQTAYTGAGGLATDAVYTTDVSAAAGTNDAVLVTDNTALVTATTAVTAAEAQLDTDQATATADQAAYVAAGGLNTDAVYTTDISAAAGTNDAVLVTDNTALAAATAPFVAAAAQLVADKAVAAIDQTAYLAAGGSNTDPVYTTDHTAATGTNDAVLVTDNTALKAATLAFAGGAAAQATAQLNADIVIATADQGAYTGAGGLNTDLVYTTDVTAATGTNDAVLQADNTALAAATAAVTAAAAQLATDQATATADQAAYTTAGGLATDLVYTTDVSAAGGTNDAVLQTDNTALAAATTAVAAAVAQLAADKASAAIDQTAYLAAGGSNTNSVYTTDHTAATGTNDAVLQADNTALKAATTALTAAAAQLAADKATAATDQMAYLVAGRLAGNAVFTTDATAAIGTNDAALQAANAALVAATVVAPSAPTAVIATGGQNSITVSWSAPASNGGSAITGYVVTATAGNTTVSCGTVVATATTCTPLGLANATAYAVSVEAVNATGASTAGTASATTLPAIVVVPVFRVTGVHGTAIAGRTVTLTISGTGFYGRPTVRSNVAGTRAIVIHDTGHLLTVRVTTRAGTPRGVGIFTVRLANGKTARVHYHHA